MMRDYWLSKLFFDLQAPAAAEEYRADRDSVLDRYPLKPEVRLAVVAVAARRNFDLDQRCWLLDTPCAA